MRRIYKKRKQAEVKINLLFATHKRPIKVNIIDKCEACYFLKKVKNKFMCTAWGSNNLIHIKFPRGVIIEENCCLFDYESSSTGKSKRDKEMLVGKVYTNV
jgi:hypothetical protein